MNHCVPDFEIQMDDEYQIPSSSGSGVPHSKKPSMPEDDIMELLWQNGQVVMQSQNQRPLRKTPPDRYTDGVIPSGPSTAREIRPSQQEQNYHNHHLFMQEDEMTSWLHYPIVDDPPLDHNFCADIIYTPPPPPPPPPQPTVNNSNRNNNSTMQNLVRTNQVTELWQPSRSVAPRPPIPPPRKPEQVHTMIPNFAHFSNHNARFEPAEPSSSKTAVKESTVVDSCDTPAVVASASRVSETIRNSAEATEGGATRRTVSTAGVAATSTGGETGGREATTCEMTTTSSPGGSSGSDEPARRPPAEDRKRKGLEAEDSECHCELKDVDFESAEAKRQICGSTSTKRSRAAEVHNLSERRRRDRINEKMKALQELIPRCNKSDKASMLDEAIEYLKSLQLQVQMMSMGCGMVPMMFPGIQQYMPAMGMGIGMGMEMGMNRPLMPFPNMLAASALPATASAAAAAATAHLGTRFPMPPFPDSSRMPPPPPPNQSDNSMLSSRLIPDPNQSRIPNFTDPYHQYFGPHQMHLQFMQAMNNPNVSKRSTSKSHENTENNQSGA